MRGAGIHFADLARSSARPPDAVLASDFLNLSDWRALAPKPFRDAPCVLYFHENQITYPLGAEAPKDFQYGWINLSSALSAERVLFNSSYHREEFLGEVERVLALMPDHVPPDIPQRLRAASEVFPVGIDFEPHRAVRGEVPRPRNPRPVIVWNHRWEHDKGPEILTDTLMELKKRGIPFHAIICGQSCKKIPAALARMKELREEVLHMGFFPQVRDYLAALRKGDIVLSTSRHEFFGVAVVEAMFMGCLPVLPHALSYPEIIPPPLHPHFLYKDAAALPGFLADFLSRPPVEHRFELEEAASRFDWKVLAARLDEIIAETFARGRG